MSMSALACYQQLKRPSLVREGGYTAMSRRSILSGPRPLHGHPAPIGDYERLGNERPSKERCQLAHCGVHIFRNPIRFDVCRAINLEKFLVLRSSGFGECVLRHIEAVS